MRNIPRYALRFTLVVAVTLMVVLFSSCSNPSSILAKAKVKLDSFNPGCKPPVTSQATLTFKVTGQGNFSWTSNPLPVNAVPLNGIGEYDIQVPDEGDFTIFATGEDKVAPNETCEQDCGNSAKHPECSGKFIADLTYKHSLFVEQPTSSCNCSGAVPAPNTYTLVASYESCTCK